MAPFLHSDKLVSLMRKPVYNVAKKPKPQGSTLIAALAKNLHYVQSKSYGVKR